MSQQKTKKSGVEALSRFGKTGRLILIAGILVVIAAALYFVYHQQEARQSTFNKDLAKLQKQITATTPRQDEIKREIAQANEEIETTKSLYASLDKAPEILEKLLALAKENGIDVTSSRITNISKQVEVGKEKISYPALGIQLGLRGQVPKFQNFLRDVGSTFSISEIKSVTISPAKDEKQEDTATVAIDIFCLDGMK